MKTTTPIYPPQHAIGTDRWYRATQTLSFELFAALGPALLVPLAVLCQAAFMQQRDNRMGVATSVASMRPVVAAADTARTASDGAAPTTRVQRAGPPHLVLASIVQGLRSPDGIAVDSATGRIYVSEEDAGRILSLEEDQITVVVDRHTPIYSERDGERTPAPPIRFPEGIAIGADGTLYAVEDLPGGRLIQFAVDPEGASTWGREVPLPFARHDYAWESVSIGPQGELLLAGSTAEHVLYGGEPGLFEGILLYRDEAGAWWDAYRRPMVSFSTAAISSDGDIAAYACEITGEIGWLDLTQRAHRSAASTRRFSSPEGLCILPDGTLLIAEEMGRLWHLDPATDVAELLHKDLGSIESVVYSPFSDEILVTGDEHGELLRFRADPASLAGPAPFQGHFEAEETAAYPFVPETCPIYLTEVLKMAGYDPETATGESFAELATRLSILAVDARAVLLNGPETAPEDPIEHVQFVIFHPGMLGLDLPGLVAPVSGFAARHQSGTLVKTVVESREFLHADFVTTVIQALGPGKISIPYAGPAALLNGAAFASFLGLGRTPDFCFNIDPYNREESRMTVLQADGAVHHYRLDLIPSEHNREWVVAMRPKPVAGWSQLSHAQRIADMPQRNVTQLAAIGGATQNSL